MTPVTHATHMTFVPHLVRKDLRAIAIVAPIWILLMSIEVAIQLTGVNARLRDPGRPSLLQQVLYFLPLAEVAIIALIVSMVIHEDPLVDARAFWLTRPIPRGQLFLAKLIAIAVVLFAPALTALAILLAWYHVPPVYMMRAGLEVALWLAFPLLFLTAAATLTPTLSRYLALLFCVIAGTVATFGLLESFSSVSSTASVGVVAEPRLPRYPDPARQLTITFILIAGFCVVLLQFYRRRDWRIALGSFALVFGLATVFARYAPGFRMFEPPGDIADTWAANVSLRLLDDQRAVSAYHPRELRSVAAPLVLDGLPGGYSATPFTLKGQLTRADGTVLRSGRSGPVQMTAKGAYQPSLTFTYRNDPIDAGPTRWEAWPILLALPSGHRAPVSSPVGAAISAAGGADEANAADDGPPYYAGSYTGTFMYRIARHEKVAALPLDRQDARFTDGPRGIRIVATNVLGVVCRVTLEVTNTELTLAGPREPAPGYYFADRATGARLRAVHRNTRSNMLGPLRAGLAPGRRIFTVARVEWDVDHFRDNSPAAISPCNEADVIFVRTIAAGSLTRSIELPDFRVQPSQDAFFRR